MQEFKTITLKGNKMKIQSISTRITILVFLFCILYSGNVYPHDTLRAIIHTKSKDGLLSDSATPMFCDNRGNIWADFNGKGVGYYNRHEWVTFDMTNGLLKNKIGNKFIDSLGNIWIQYDSLGWGVYDGKTWKNHVLPTQVTDPNNFSYSFSEKNGNVWFICGTWNSSDNGIGYYNGNNWTHFDTTNGLASNVIKKVRPDSPNSRVWVVYDSKGVGFFDGNSWHNFTKKDGLFKDTVDMLVVNAKGQAFTSFSASRYNYDYELCGYSYYDGNKWKNGSSGYIQNVCVDAVGDIWFGCKIDHGDDYLGRFHDTTLTMFTDATLTFQNYAISQFAPAVDGTMWIQYQLVNNGIAFFDGKKFHQYPEYYLGRNDIDYDANGYPWATYRNASMFSATSGEYGICRYNGTIWQFFTDKDGLAHSAIRSSIHDRHGNTYALYGSPIYNYDRAHGVAFFNGSSWSTFSTLNGLKSDDVNSIAIDSMDNVWITYTDTTKGISCYFQKNWVTFSSETGTLPANVRNIWCMPNGETWGMLEKNNGLVQFTTDSLLQIPVRIQENNSIKSINSAAIFIRNGLLYSSGIKGSKGTISFFTLNGRQVYHAPLIITNGTIQYRFPICFKNQLLTIKIQTSDQSILKPLLLF